jgi:hypothetical protein
LGAQATLRSFTEEESAGSHSHPGASVLVNGVVYDWLSDTLDQPRAPIQPHQDAAREDQAHAAPR